MSDDPEKKKGDGEPSATTPLTKGSGKKPKKKVKDNKQGESLDQEGQTQRERSFASAESFYIDFSTALTVPQVPQFADTSLSQAINLYVNKTAPTFDRSACGDVTCGACCGIGSGYLYVFPVLDLMSSWSGGNLPLNIVMSIFALYGGVGANIGVTAFTALGIYDKWFGQTSKNSVLVKDNKSTSCAAWTGWVIMKLVFFTLAVSSALVLTVNQQDPDRNSDAAGLSIGYVGDAITQLVNTVIHLYALEILGVNLAKWVVKEIRSRLSWNPPAVIAAEKLEAALLSGLSAQLDVDARFYITNPEKELNRYFNPSTADDGCLSDEHKARLASQAISYVVGDDSDENPVDLEKDESKRGGCISYEAQKTWVGALGAIVTPVCIVGYDMFFYAFMKSKFPGISYGAKVALTALGVVPFELLVFGFGRYNLIDFFTYWKDDKPPLVSLVAPKALKVGSIAAHLAAALSWCTSVELFLENSDISFIGKVMMSILIAVTTYVFNGYGPLNMIKQLLVNWQRYFGEAKLKIIFDKVHQAGEMAKLLSGYHGDEKRIQSFLALANEYPAIFSRLVKKAGIQKQELNPDAGRELARPREVKRTFERFLAEVHKEKSVGWCPGVWQSSSPDAGSASNIQAEADPLLPEGGRKSRCPKLGCVML